MKKLIAVAALAATFGAAEIHAQGDDDVPQCRFVNPTNSYPALIVSHYRCRPFVPYVRSCSLLWYTRWWDVYFAKTDDDFPCALVGYPFYERPLYIDMGYAGTPFTMWAQAFMAGHFFTDELPWHCPSFIPLCVLGGSAQVVAFGPGLPAIHFRPYVATVYFN
ncbi:MAG: hypothetical protein OXH09_14485 [Gammaproteobacteria bacterium]|nr:hypothetical protein [Gammaproteobacteria bacterium]